MGLLLFPEQATAVVPLFVSEIFSSLMSIVKNVVVVPSDPIDLRALCHEILKERGKKPPSSEMIKTTGDMLLIRAEADRLLAELEGHFISRLFPNHQTPDAEDTSNERRTIPFIDTLTETRETIPADTLDKLYRDGMFNDDEPPNRAEFTLHGKRSPFVGNEDQTTDDTPLTPEETEELLARLESRFTDQSYLHPEVYWDAVEASILKDPKTLMALRFMERTGGEPDVIRVENGEFVFGDTSKESPSIRGDHKDALAIATPKYGIQVMSDDDYKYLKKCKPTIDKMAHSSAVDNEMWNLPNNFTNGTRIIGRYGMFTGALYSKLINGFRCTKRIKISSTLETNLRRENIPKDAMGFVEAAQHRYKRRLVTFREVIRFVSKTTEKLELRFEILDITSRIEIEEKLLDAVRTRFEALNPSPEGVQWNELEVSLRNNKKAFATLEAMEMAGGLPNVIRVTREKDGSKSVIIGNTAMNTRIGREYREASNWALIAHHFPFTKESYETAIMENTNDMHKFRALDADPIIKGYEGYKGLLIVKV